MKRIFVFLGIALVILLQLNCSSEQEQEKINNPTLSGVTDDINAAPLVEEVNLESMYEDEVRKLATKTPVQIITAIEGTSKVIIDAEFRRVRTSGFGFPLYECVLTDEAVQSYGGCRSRDVWKSCWYSWEGFRRTCLWGQLGRNTPSLSCNSD